MKKELHSLELTVYESEAELPPEDASLLQAALKAQEDAYAPYSEFKVGAAVLLVNGEVVIGNNQENASYPSGLCAERVAVFHAGARYPGVPILKIAIAAGSSEKPLTKPAAPCGNCRQSIFEYENKQDRPIELLLLGGAGKVYKCPSVQGLLPLAFGKEFL
ncbi:cytidine deaminase [Muriicola jejuensis]|uniref:Cytidine deaminase n=1 Tax=Muriicola jejuensis TaxID=504488 RepID=A0A6P0UCZ5_9FLAO|nr:cytidine deaminase [Muriicola jejuensis]NER10462.1 cytidine deaminase [Muriicola jejuensis]SMP18614.1 cytidine deaminase [Muriicola jejuensis]